MAVKKKSWLGSLIDTGVNTVKQNKYVQWTEKKVKETWNNVTKPKNKTQQKSKAQQKSKTQQKSKAQQKRQPPPPKKTNWLGSLIDTGINMVKQNKYVQWAEKKVKEVWNNITKPKKKTSAQKSKTQQKRKPNQKSVSPEEIAAWAWGKAEDGVRWAENKINSIPGVKYWKNMMKVKVIDQKPLKGARSKASEQKIKQAYLHDPERNRGSSKALPIKEALAQKNPKNLYALPLPQRKSDPEVVAYYKSIKVNEESQKAARQLNSTLLGSFPVIGGFKNSADFIIGHDIATGEKISRGDAVLGAATGGLSKLYKLSKSSGFNQFNKKVPQASQGQGTGNSMPSKQSKPTQGTGKNISHPVLDNTRSGSGLKKPDGQHGFNDIIDNYTPYSKEFEIVGGDGVKRKLYQIEGGMKYYDYKDVYSKDLRIKERITTVKDQNGIFEWIVDPTKGVTHRRFIPNGKITGVPNQRP
ncbi:pre-toxin TG domain-containing protein [Aneurinibacillus aneurinilyticus]|jgi:hypothetical protein|uniref:pre-toxin TG domain-containing protein n=1 Tax=Aneurinibacillus aneurinilyticus TaxID=1391 RepID=UPI0023F81A3E|nr:pre-toxin TG domain-containing protein [Aneurinibacillus aneurinilyticus]MCI1696915.1 pre-toxin TG domain-containing protein [Aneurinibacillus aneurinilyticus]